MRWTFQNRGGGGAGITFSSKQCDKLQNPVHTCKVYQHAPFSFLHSTNTYILLLSYARSVASCWDYGEKPIQKKALTEFRGYWGRQKVIN